MLASASMATDGNIKIGMSVKCHLIFFITVGKEKIKTQLMPICILLTLFVRFFDVYRCVHHNIVGYVKQIQTIWHKSYIE